MPRCHRQTEEDFILNQLDHIQFAYHRQKIPGIVFQFILRQLGTLRNQFQKTVDIKITRHGFQATLAGKREDSRHHQMQHGFSAITLKTRQTESNLSPYLCQQIMQATKILDNQRSLENTTISGKSKSVRNPFQS